MHTETLSKKTYRNDFVNSFNGDESGNPVPRQTPNVFYSKALPTPVKQPRLLAWSDELAKELGIEKPTDQKEIDILAGNFITPTMGPYADRYGGNQFGNSAGQSGDGGALTLGAWEAPAGRRGDLWLKGEGSTP